MKSLQSNDIEFVPDPSLLLAAESDVWSLKPIDGDNTKQWASGSWTWEHG